MTDLSAIARVLLATGFAAVSAGAAAQSLTNLGLQPVSNTPDEFRTLIRAEIDKWGKVVKAANIKGSP